MDISNSTRGATPHMSMQVGLPLSRMPRGFSRDDFNFSKLYKCIQQEGQNTMCDVSQALYLYCHVNSTGGTISLRDYFTKVLMWSNEKLKRTFNTTDQPLLDSNPLTQSFDISFAFKLMNHGCSNIYNELNERCKYHMSYLKTMRNKLCHKYGCHNLNVETEIDNLKMVLREIYVHVGVTLGRDFTENIDAMEKNLNDVCDAEIRQDDMVSYEEDIEEFKRNKSNKLIINGRSELEILYKKFRVLNPCTWMLDTTKSSVSKFFVDKIFTPLKIEDSNRPTEIEMAELLTITTQITDEVKIPCALLLHGLAGCGKTSLCQYILNDWYRKTEKILNLKNFDLVFLVEVRTVKSRHLMEYLCEQRIIKTSKDFDSSEIIRLLQDLDVLFIIDGFDEANELSKGVVEEIFAKFQNHRIVLTTRPEYQRDAILMSRKHHVDYLSVEICGFDDRRLVEFTNKVFTVVEDNKILRRQQIDEFLKYINGRGKVLGSHLRLPLTLALLIYLWKDNPQTLNRVTTATSLYCELFNLCQRKLEERLEIVSQDRSTVKEVLLFLGEQAWNMLKSGNICITKEIINMIKQKCEEKQIDDTQFLSAFLMCEIDETHEAAEHTYAFLHKTQMEYLAAEFLASDVMNGKSLCQISKTRTDWYKYQEVIVFLTGHLAVNQILERNVSKLFSLIDKSEVEGSFNFWWKIFTEALGLTEVGTKIAEDKLPSFTWKLDHVHVVAGLSLLSNTIVKLENLTIEMPSNVEPYEIPELLDTMRNMKNTLKGKYNKKNPILVELHFWRHNEYNCPQPSDEFIRTLYPWGHLTNFTGSLGHQKKNEEVLAYCFKLKSIRVRVETTQALGSLSNSLLKIYKSIKKLRITLAMPPNCDPKSLAKLQFKGDLEVIVPDITDENKEWLALAIKQVGLGCKNISLPESQLTFSGVMWLLDNLRNIGCGKISIKAINASDEEMDRLLKQQTVTSITINWLD
ncbi:uncharacterized protein [Procambarus clarkii]|uniref:uncharacterized protein n=1 Tax=Procambarus clarkii TaxID=6728 RepID=UPI001E6706ED|nr:uncharacterized protein LOC123762014 [Procambarus clarkii]